MPVHALQQRLGKRLRQSRCACISRGAARLACSSLCVPAIVGGMQQICQDQVQALACTFVPGCISRSVILARPSWAVSLRLNLRPSLQGTSSEAACAAPGCSYPAGP